MSILPQSSAASNSSTPMVKWSSSLTGSEATNVLSEFLALLRAMVK